MERICEPELMDDPLQARIYAEADFSSTDGAFTERILSLLGAPAAAGNTPLRIVDLGCGPGNITFRLASALPGAAVLGLDGAAAMLAIAEERRSSLQPPAAAPRFHLAHLPLEPEALATLPPPFSPPYDLIVSNSLLHHLHQPAVLWNAVHSLAAPGALVVVRDLRRPPDPEALQWQVERRTGTAPAILRRDYGHSLAAAFLPSEVGRQLAAAGLSSLEVQAVDEDYLEAWGRI